MLTNLKIVRMKKEQTQFQVAHALGLDQSYLSKLENKQVPFTNDLLEKLAEYYGVEQKELI